MKKPLRYFNHFVKLDTWQASTTLIIIMIIPQLSSGISLSSRFSLGFMTLMVVFLSFPIDKNKEE